MRVASPTLNRVFIIHFMMPFITALIVMGESGTSCDTWFVGPRRFNNPNDRSIGSAVFAQLTQTITLGATSVAADRIYALLGSRCGQKLQLLCIQSADVAYRSSLSTTTAMLCYLLYTHHHIDHGPVAHLGFCEGKGQETKASGSRRRRRRGVGCGEGLSLIHI